MGFRHNVALLTGRAVTWGMGKLGRGATTLPGRIGLAIDPDFIANHRHRIGEGSIVVCGTNGKTTTNNIIAHVLESVGSNVACNRAGANMRTGVASALMPAGAFDWGVFECDELSTPQVVPALQPRYFLLLNLFRDQLDRCGELDRIQETIAAALAASPRTTFVYNADDPLCRAVAIKVAATGAPTVPFGVGEDLGLPGDRVVGGAFCQMCGAPLDYRWRQYGQLGSYQCPACGFGTPDLVFSARGVRVGRDGVHFEVHRDDHSLPAGIGVAWGGHYMVYNLLGAYVVCSLAGVPATIFEAAASSYAPRNGRLQGFVVDGRRVTLNLAKNPTGFNQNLAMLGSDPVPKAAYIVINDNANDGHDVSWLWDVDFERLADSGVVRVFVGGLRANDMQVRLKYAGIPALIADDVASVVESLSDVPDDARLWVLTNYSALWPVKAELTRIGEER